MLLSQGVIHPSQCHKNRDESFLQLLQHRLNRVQWKCHFVADGGVLFDKDRIHFICT